MTAYSFKSYATRERIPGDRTPLLTVQHGHPLNNDHRAPFASGATAARGLLVHAQRELSDPARGPEYFNRLRQMYDSATINGQLIKQRLRQRQSRAANALANSDIELTGEQLQIVADIAMIQAELGEAILPAVTAAGHGADTVIDQIDVITRNALRAATFLRTEQSVGEEVDPNAWVRDLHDRLAAAPGADMSEEGSTARADLVTRFSGLIYKLEAELPLAIDRDEPLYEIDDALDPTEVALTVDKLSTAMGADFNPSDLAQEEELSYQAKQAIWQSMSKDEREFAATKIALTPGQRIEVGMQIVNSTPPVIRLPEAELGQGRFDVRMATEEEARAMDALIRLAGEERTYPGPELAAQRVEGLKEIAMSSGEQGRYTIGLAVANNPASIAHASGLVAKISENPEARVIIHADNPQVAAELQRVRTEALAAQGREAVFKDGADATRDFGGWTLPDNGEDRILGGDPRDATIFVANVDKVWAYPNSSSLEATSRGAALDAIANAGVALRATQNDLKNAVEQMEASRDQKLVARAAELAEAGKDNKKALEAANASADAKLVKAVASREEALSAAQKTVNAANLRYETINRQAEQDAYRVTAPGDLARATIIDLSQQQGKLSKVYVPGSAEQGTAVKTEAGLLTEQRAYVAQQKAQRLRNGDSVERGNLRRLFHAQRGVNATLVDGSNFFREDKGAAKGFAALRDRIDAIPGNGTILTSNNSKNAISSEVATKLGRPVVLANAWRVSDHSTPIGPDGRRVTLSDRMTELDLGYVSYKGQSQDENGKSEDAQRSRPREWAYKDLKGAVVIVNGGGSMTRDTYEAIQELAAAKGAVGHALNNDEVRQLHHELVANGRAHLEAPKFANPQLSRAIMQEALVDYASQAVLATDMGKDYHSANLIRQAIDADKLASVIDKNGNTVPLEKAHEHSLQFAQSISDNTRKDLDLNVSASSEFGQLVLAGLPGVNFERARRMGETYATLSDVMQAAEANEASAALPRNLHHDLSRPNSWASAIERANNIENYADRSMMDAVSATNPMYPQNVRDAGRSDMLYTMGEVDLNAPTLALVIGGKTKPHDTDVEAARKIAAEAKEKGWAVSIHLSGDTSASIAKAVAEMPEAERPRILLVGDGHPYASGNAKTREAFAAVGHAGGGYVTSTPPTPKQDKEADGEVSYKADRRAALDLQGRQASGIVVMKSNGNDMEMLALRSALQAGRPVAAVGPSDMANPTVADLRYRGSEYSANQRLLAGGDRISVMLDTRHMAFQPNFIPDMTAQTEDRYVPFEGSTAGMMNAPDNNRKEPEIDHSAIESGSRMSTTIAWRDRAEYIADGHGAGDFIAKIEAGEAREIAAKEADIAAMARKEDIKFLDVSHRLHTRADVAAIFTEVNERAHEAIDADMQQHFLAQRAGMAR